MKRGAAKNIDEYIAGFPEDVQKKLQKVRATIRKAVPKAEEVISYGIPAFRLSAVFIYFAGFKKHISIYPAPRGTAEFKKELSEYGGGKGTVQFPLDKPIPYDLIVRIAKFRAAEDLEKVERKRK